MNTITWLHLSGWHHSLEQPTREGFNRKVVKSALLEDIKNRVYISERLRQIDFVIFSGDLAFSGQADEFEAAYLEFLEPVLDAVHLEADRLYIVPGNHDLDRSVFKYLPSEQGKPLNKEGNEIAYKAIEWLSNNRYKESLLEPFENYQKFITERLKSKITSYADITINTVKLRERRIVFLGFNTALMCGRITGKQKKSQDNGAIFIGEPQANLNLSEIQDTDIVISVMHHPFSWLHQSDRILVERLIKKNSHFILHGHEHQPDIQQVKSTMGQYVIVPAGTCYDRNTYRNFYNFVNYDLNTQNGEIFFRHWSSKASKWQKDIDINDNGSLKFELSIVPQENSDNSNNLNLLEERKTIFIYSQVEDYSYLANLNSFLEKYQKSNVIRPMNEKEIRKSSAKEIDADFKYCVSTCNAVILIHATSSNAWIRRKIMECIQYSKIDKNITFIGVIITNFDDKSGINIEHELLENFYCTSNLEFISLDCLPKLAEKLQKL